MVSEDFSKSVPALSYDLFYIDDDDDEAGSGSGSEEED